MIDSFQLYRELESMDLLTHRPLRWWPNAGTFEVIIGAILTQNTTWFNVERSLKNLEGHLTLESLLALDVEALKEHIYPSGFYNQKAPRLLTLAQNIKKEFGTFEAFRKTVTREWLLVQKGIGPETADSILCYGCFRDEMVMDSYTKRLLGTYGIAFSSYNAYKSYLEKGIREQCREHCHEELSLIFARFHGMIVEYSKMLKNKDKKTPGINP